MTPQEHTKAIANIELRRKTTRSAWRVGNKHVTAQFSSIEAVNQFYDKMVAEANASLATHTKPSAPVVSVQSVTTVQPNSAVTNVSVETTPKEITEDTKVVKSYQSPNQIAKLRNWQDAASDDCFDCFFVKNHDAHLLSSGVGTGKTFMVGKILRRILDLKMTEGKCITPYPLVVVTAASVVEQFSRDLEYQFGIDIGGMEVLVTNYDQLRSKFGERFVKESTVVVNGEPEIKYTWSLMMAPFLIVWDECHKLKNEGSTQSKLAQALNNLPQGRTKQLFMSATSFTRIADAKCFTVATRCSMY